MVICCVSWNHSLPFWFWHLVNSMKWPYYPTDILALCETKLDDSIDSGNFFERGYIDLIQKDSVTHINGLALYLKKGYPFAKDLSQKKLCKFLFMTVFTYSVSYFFFFYQLPFSSLFTIFNAVSSNTDEVLLINTSATAFVCHKNLLIYFGWSDRPGQLCCHFSISNYFIHIVNFPSWFPDCGLHNPAFYLFLSSDNSIYSTMASPPMGNSIVLLSWFPLSFCYIQKGMTRFIALLM